MKEKLNKIRPTNGFAHVTHFVLRVILPIIAFVLVRIDFGQLALALVLLGKWRIFSVRPRHWPAIIRANGVDIIAGLSFVLAMMAANNQLWQIVWMILYGLWLVVAKPKSSQLWIGLQALIAQSLGLAMAYLSFPDLQTVWLVLLVWVITYTSARHFLSAYDEPLASPIAHAWAFFAAAFVAVMHRWLLYYGVVAQPVIAISILGYGLAAMYYLHELERLTPAIKRQFVFVMSVVILFIIILADWGDKVVQY